LTALLAKAPVPGNDCTKEFPILQIPIASISWVASIDLPAAKIFNKNYCIKTKINTFKLQKALQIEIFSRMARMGRTMIADPRLDTMSLKVYEVPVVGSVNPVNAGGLISGRPAGTGPAQETF